MNEVQPIRTDAENAIISRFPDFAKKQSHWGGAEIARERTAAFEILKSKGLPSRRVEEWKYTDLRAMLRDMPSPAEAPSREAVEVAAREKSAIDLSDAFKFLFVNGKNFAMVKAEGFEIYSLANGDKLPKAVSDTLARERKHALNAAVALNTAFMTDATIIHVPAGKRLARPIHLAFRHEGKIAQSSFPRVLIVVEQGASVTIVETQDGPAGVAYFDNATLKLTPATRPK